VIGHDDAVEGGLVGAVAREANVNSHESSEYRNDSEGPAR
jgi:hypothetical protein